MGVLDGKANGKIGKGNDQGGKAGSKGKGGGLNPAVLTSYLKNAQSVQELLQHCSTNNAALNHIHLSAAWGSLGQRVRQEEGASWVLKHTKALKTLVKQTTAAAAGASAWDSKVRARQLANIAHGVAKSGVMAAPEDFGVAELITALVSAITPRLAADSWDRMKAQEFASAAWAFAKVERLEGEFAVAMAEAAERDMSTFNTQELTNVAWAFATAGYSDDNSVSGRKTQLFRALTKAIQNSLKDFTCQGLANTAWAFARAGHLDAAFFRSVAQAAAGQADRFNAQDLANTAWAFAKLGQFDGELFAALSAVALRERYLDSFSAQGLANTVWAFAKAGQLDNGLFSAFAESVRTRLSDFNCQDLANTAWGFAKACHVDPPLFKALANSILGSLDDFNLQDLVNTAWAFAKVGQTGQKRLFTGVARVLVQRRLLAAGANPSAEASALTASHIANVAWAFSKANQLNPQLLSALVCAAAERVGDFSPQELVSMAWAFANAAQGNEGLLDEQKSLFSALARATKAALAELNDEELANAEWAFAKVGQHGAVKRIKERRKGANNDGGDTQDAHGGGHAGTGLGAAGDEEAVAMCGRIIVAGGGVAGGALAVALHRRGFRDVVVLEGDESFEVRAQGYGFTIQNQDAVLRLGLDLTRDDAPSTSHYTFSKEGNILGFFGEAFSANKRGEDCNSCSGSSRFIHLPRQMLRQRILEQVPPQMIRWSSKLQSFKEKRGGVKVILTDGTKLKGSLLVGCDGIFSTVRKQLQLPADRLNYVGLIVVLGIVDYVPPLTERRIFETVDGVTRIYCMPFTKASTMWQLSFPCDQQTAKRLGKDKKALKAEILERCKTWHDPIPQLLKDTPMEGFSGYPVYDRETLEPESLRSAGDLRRVTLMGDAAHPMTPFKAQGANQALSDSVLLADTLADAILREHNGEGAASPDLCDRALDSALPSFERKMLSRMARAVLQSREKAREMHSALALQQGRKVQREAGAAFLDMQRAIPRLRELEVGAWSAADERGLDAVVAEAIRDGRAAPATAKKRRRASEVEEAAPAFGREAVMAAGESSAKKRKRCKKAMEEEGGKSHEG